MTRLLRPCLLLVFCLVFHLAPGEEESAVPQAPSTVRKGSFEVTGPDVLSAHYVAAVGDLLTQRLSRVLPAPGRATQPVAVDLLPEEDERASAMAPFGTRLYRGGQVVVTIVWGEATTRATVERALAQAYLSYLSGAYSGGRIHVPLWLELASQHLARVQAVPAHSQALAARIDRNRPPRLEEIFALDRAEPVGEDMDAYAYWLLRFLSRESRNRVEVQNFLIRLLRGEEAMLALRAAFGDRLRTAEEARLWWLVGLGEIVGNPRSPILPAPDSRRRVGELARLTFAVEGGEERLFPEDLWEKRESPALRRELRRRLRVVQLELDTIHPFYHNALLSMGRVWQAVLAEAEAEEEYEEAVLAFQHDTRAGEELWEDVSGILDDLSVELAQ